MRTSIGRRLDALEAKTGVGYRPMRLAYFRGTREENEKEVEAEAAKAEANGENLYAVFFVPPTYKP